MFDQTGFAASVERAEGLTVDATALQARQAGLDAEQAELVLEFERLRADGVASFRDAEAFLRNATGMARSTAHTRVRAFRQLLVLPTMRHALHAGTVTFDHVRALADHADSPNRDAVVDEEAQLTAWAAELPADAFRERLASWIRDLDEQRLAGLTEHERQVTRRRVVRSRTKDGLRRTVLELDDESDAVVYGALRDIVKEMRRNDRAAKLPPDQRRTTGQYFADAARDLAHRSRAADIITKHRARPTILAITEMSVLWDQLRVNGVCELDDGTQLTGAQLRRLACEADIIPIVLSGDGVPFDAGRTFRLATYRQRLLLRTVHPTCAVEGCDVPFDDCEIHHLHPWERGGRTDLDNLVPLCGYHHTWVHDLDGNVTMELLPDRTLRLPGLPLEPCPRRRNPLVERLKHPSDRVPARA
ncbi:MAG TPA: DUF222 domain-containing protein [Acidimicrobiales bacterium]|nr:DUF222 domain-containing protein [Acidimicrobiales bacterium]